MMMIEDIEWKMEGKRGPESYCQLVIAHKSVIWAIAGAIQVYIFLFC